MDYNEAVIHLLAELRMSLAEATAQRDGALLRVAGLEAELQARTQQEATT